jgi:hypothetical protein
MTPDHHRRRPLGLHVDRRKGLSSALPVASLPS